VEPLTFKTRKDANEHVKFEREKGHRVPDPRRIPLLVNGKVVGWQYVVHSLPDDSTQETTTSPLSSLAEAEAAQSELKQGLKRLDKGTQESVDTADGQTRRDTTEADKHTDETIRNAGKYPRRGRPKP